MTPARSRQMLHCQTEQTRERTTSRQAVQEWPEPGHTYPSRVRAYWRGSHPAKGRRAANHRTRAAPVVAGGARIPGAARRGLLPDPGSAYGSSRSLMRYLLSANVVSDLVRWPQGSGTTPRRPTASARKPLVGGARSAQRDGVRDSLQAWLGRWCGDARGKRGRSAAGVVKRAAAASLFARQARLGLVLGYTVARRPAHSCRVLAHSSGTRFTYPTES